MNNGCMKATVYVPYHGMLTIKFHSNWVIYLIFSLMYDLLNLTYLVNSLVLLPQLLPQLSPQLSPQLLLSVNKAPNIL